MSDLNSPQDIVMLGYNDHGYKCTTNVPFLVPNGKLINKLTVIVNHGYNEHLLLVSENLL